MNQSDGTTPDQIFLTSDAQKIPHDQKEGPSSRKAKRRKALSEFLSKHPDQQETSSSQASLDWSGENSGSIIDKARSYQQELYERARDENTIAVLETGSGKTLIAAMLIRHMYEQEIIDRASGHIPRTMFFLVNSVHLVHQQCRFLSQNLSFIPIPLHGDDNTDLWNRSDWEKVFKSTYAVVCTAEVLYQCLMRNFINMSQIGLLVFDEAHHCKKNHPYACIIRDYYIPHQDRRPRIFGMTASPVQSKKNVEKATVELESLLQAKIITTKDTSLFESAPLPTNVVWTYEKLHGAADTGLAQTLFPMCQLVEELQRYFELARKIHMYLGAWCAHQLWKYALGVSAGDAAALVKRFEKSDAYQDLETSDVRRQAMQALNEAILITQDYTIEPPLPSQGSLSSKCLLLYQELKVHYRKNPETRCMVFVDERMTAVLLSDCFTGLRIPELRCGYLVGSGKVGMRVVSWKDQEQVMETFKHGIINLVFSTNVAEEGIDVPRCNLVVRFDLYSTTIQYMQSRGRARMKDSIYAQMIESGNCRQKQMVDYAVASETYIKQYCQSLRPDRLLGQGTELARMIAKDSINGTFKTSSGAVCNFNNCLLLLSRYVSSLQSDGLPTRENYEEIIIEPDERMFQYLVRLPTNELSKVKGARGDPRSNKSLAKRDAAFKCVCLLRANGLLNDNLDSIFCKVKPVNHNARLAVSSKKDAYPMKVKPEVWDRGLGSAPTVLYASILRIHPLKPVRRPFLPLLILTRIQLPEIPGFSILIDNDIETEVSINTKHKVYSINQVDLDLITAFTVNAVFGDVFNKVYEADAKQLGYWLAPLVSMEDHDPGTLAKLFDYDALKLANTERVRWKSGMGSELWRDKFLVDPRRGNARYFSVDVLPGMSIWDPVPTEFQTQNQETRTSILELTLGRRLKQKDVAYFTNFDSQQPILDAELVSTRRDFLGASKEKSYLQMKRPIAPQFLEVGRLSQGIATTILVWPSVIYRIESYLIASEAFDKLGLHGIPLNSALEAYTQGGFEDGLDENQDIACQQTTDRSYERLEFLGDSFLKMMTSITVFNKTKCDEEGMHCRRMAMLCNRRLYEVATGHLELFKYVRTLTFNRDHWYPENVVLLRGRGAKTPPVPVKHAHNHDLSMKTIADVCEATIGAALEASRNAPKGQEFDLAIKAITRLVESEDHAISKWTEIPTLYQALDWQLHMNDPLAIDLAAKIEAKVGYKFRYPRLARSAFTHSSDLNSPVPDLQRLEFLGDACLDWVCVDWLYHTNPDRDPQWLTEHKMAMVSNKFLAALAVILDFDKFIFLTGPQLLDDISKYAAQVRQAYHQPSVRPDFWTQIDNPPKALSDLVESTLGAILVDSEFDYSQIDKFFTRHVQWFFSRIEDYDSFANRHPTTFLFQRLSKELNCDDFAVECTEPSDVVSEAEIVAAVLVHNQVIAISKGQSRRYAKVRASRSALGILDGLSIENFRQKFKCDCKRGRQAEPTIVSSLERNIS